MAIQVFADDHPLVVDGSHDIYGFTPKERRLQAKRIKDAALDLYVALKACVEMYGPSDLYGHDARIVWEQAEAALAKASKG